MTFHPTTQSAHWHSLLLPATHHQKGWSPFPPMPHASLPVVGGAEIEHPTADDKRCRTNVWKRAWQDNDITHDMVREDAAEALAEALHLSVPFDTLAPPQVIMGGWILLLVAHMLGEPPTPFLCLVFQTTFCLWTKDSASREANEHCRR